MATSLDTGVPWVMCQQADAPDPIVSFLLFLFQHQGLVVYVLLDCLSSLKEKAGCSSVYILFTLLIL